MLQLELYVKGVEAPEKLFVEAFGMEVTEAADGWRFLHHADNFAIMLFDPDIIHEDTDHWVFSDGPRGQGIQIVMCVADAALTRAAVQKLGYVCSELYYPPWGSTEFTFRLTEGYLVRVKQPKA